MAERIERDALAGRRILIAEECNALGSSRCIRRSFEGQVPISPINETFLTNTPREARDGGFTKP